MLLMRVYFLLHMLHELIQQYGIHEIRLQFEVLKLDSMENLHLIYPKPVVGMLMNIEVKGI